MKAFRFNLQKVLEWREMQVRTAEEKLNQLQQFLATMEEQAVQVQAAYDSSEANMLSGTTISGQEMQALAAFKTGTHKQLVQIRARQQECRALIVEQRAKMLRARRDFRVLEKLKERRRQGWTYLYDRELESTASEIYLANWTQSEAEERMKGASK